MPMDEIHEIMNAVDSDDLFGSSLKRAKIRYRRLMRAVHPDFIDTDDKDIAIEASSRLNALWSEWLEVHDPSGCSANGTGGSGHANGPRKNAVLAFRNKDVALFRSDEGWLTVCRHAGSMIGTDVDAVHSAYEMTKDAPVVLPSSVETRSIHQSDGMHPAVLAPFDGVEQWWSIHDPRLDWSEPRNIAWVMKRILFLAGVFDRSGLSIPNMENLVVIAPESHVIGLISVLGATHVDYGHMGGQREANCTVNEDDDGPDGEGLPKNSPGPVQV